MVLTIRSLPLNSAFRHAAPPARAILLLAIAATYATAQTRVQTETAPLGQTITSKDIDDLGPGTRLTTLVSTTPGVLTGVIYDPKGIPRVEETDSWSIADGQKKVTGRHIFDFNANGKPLLEANYKFDPKGVLESYDISHFGLHGEKTWEQKVKYNLDGYETKTFNGFNHKWIEELTPNRPLTPQPGKPAVPLPPNPPAPIDTKVGVLIPRDLHPGQTFTGSIWPAAYAENFKSVPGLSEFTFTASMPHLPDGSPNWATLEIGVDDNGYFPVNANGLFSVNLPSTLDGSIRMQVRPISVLYSVGTLPVKFDVGKPVPAPRLSESEFSKDARTSMEESALDHLEHLWNVACDIEEDLTDGYEKTGEDYDPQRIVDLENELHEVWQDIDAILEFLPPGLVDELLHDLIKENDEYLEWLHTQPISEDHDEELNDAESWDEFLHDQLPFDPSELGRFLESRIGPFSNNPVQPADKLIGLHGPFSDDPCNSFVHIGSMPVWPIASTPTDFYAMPPNGLTAGQNSYIIDAPGFPETTDPFFLMTMILSSPNLNLHKGQSTIYDLTLNGLNGLNNSAWSAGSVPFDLVSPPASLPGASGSSIPGSITLNITNMSPSVIVMQNQLFTLNAQSFAPAGSFHTSGGITAIADGGFSVQAVATAFLQPQLGFGTPPGTNLTPVTNTLTTNPGPDFNWNPKIDWSLKSPIVNFSTDPNCSGGPVTCVSPAVQRAIDQAFNPATANMEPPAPRTVPFRPSDTALIRIHDACHHARQLGVEFSQKLGLETQAWNQAVKHLPPSTSSVYQQAADSFRQADTRFNIDWKHFGDKSISPQALRGAQQSSENFFDARQDFDTTLKDVINQFSPADRSAWESARNAANQAAWARAGALDSMRMTIRF